jgi:tetratricopeptide (TPR) repeat protein
MQRFFLSCLSGLVFSAVAVADITDLRELDSSGQAAIFIGFDDAPELLSSQINGRVIELELAGQRTGSRRIEAAGGQWIQAIEAVPSETGQLIRIELPDGADGLEILPTESGYRLSWHAISAEGGRVETADTAPVDMSEVPAGDVTSAIALPEGAPADSVERQAETIVSAGASGASLAADPCTQAASAVDADPWDIDALTRHAECLLDAGQADEATILLERVIAFEPGRFDAVIALAEAHAAQGDVDAARALYEQAANVAATDGQAIAARARARDLED